MKFPSKILIKCQNQGLRATAASPPIRQFLNIFILFYTSVLVCLVCCVKSYMVIVFFPL